jgi:hypothetical protein
MIGRIVSGAAILAALWAQPAAAADAQTVTIPGTSYAVGVGQSGQRPGAPPPMLLRAIARWLSLELDLPATETLPRIELVPPSMIASLHYQALHVPRAAASQAAAATRSDIVAVYSDATQTIYLPEHWTGATPAELSVLVHEMVHHVQRRAGLKYACAQAREQPAYAAQERWLALFGRNLIEEFEIDPMSLLIRTSCFH